VDLGWRRRRFDRGKLLEDAVGMLEHVIPNFIITQAL
jgi:hypothetical protein